MILRPGVLSAQFFISSYERIDALDQGVDWPAPRELLLARERRSWDLIVRDGHGGFEQTLSGVRPNIENNVFYNCSQRAWYFFVDREGSGVHDAHIQPGADRVIEKYRVDAFPQRVVSPEGKTDVADAARYGRTRKTAAESPHRVDKIGAVPVVGFDPGRQSEHVGIEDDVCGIVSGLFDEQAVGSRKDRHFPLRCFCLSGFVEGHHHDRRAEPLDQPRLGEKSGLAFRLIELTIAFPEALGAADDRVEA